MHNTILEPNAQESFLKEAMSPLDDDVKKVFGENFTKGGYFMFSSGIPSFTQIKAPDTISVTRNFGTSKKPRKVQKDVIIIEGRINTYNRFAEYYCPHCGSVLHGNGDTKCTLTHIPFGGSYTKLVISRHRLHCPEMGCSYNFTFKVDFKEDGHMLTNAAVNYAKGLLASKLTLKEVSIITGIDENIVKDIDKKRLQEIYTVDGEGTQLVRPKKQSKHLGIDEFKLHNNRQFATVIIDLDTGEVLYLAHTKKKQVVYDFMDFVGEEWMAGVEAVASDMNANYGKAFQDRYPDIKIVYDHFHIVKNFNEKVINEVKKDEVARLEKEGDTEGAKSLKRSKYILMSSHETLLRKDKEARHAKVKSEGGGLFNKETELRHGGNRKRHKSIIEKNELLFTADLVKEKLRHAYEADTELKMKRRINSIIRLCNGTKNKHFLWFAKLLDRHYQGIISHAICRISTGKVEGTNQMIKTLRRKGYGYPDDEYFFLKIMDASRD